MPADLASTPLRDLLAPHLRVDRRPRTWSDVARSLKVHRVSVHNWLEAGAIPPRRIEALAQLLGLPDEVQAELKRRAGVQVLVLGDA